jgi:adenylate kinase family enzyme
MSIKYSTNACLSSNSKRSRNNNNNNNNNNPENLFQKLVAQNKKTGVRISNNNNEYKSDPFNYDILANKPKETLDNVMHNNQFYQTLDININNYSREDLFKLFGIKGANLTEDILKECKKIANKTHPDKSRLDDKYFIFFSKAYNRIYEIYEFNNKMLNKKQDVSEYFDSGNSDIIKKITESKKEPSDFNNWFNEQFDKHRVENPNEVGYENWLKSEEDIVFTRPVSNKDGINSEINKYKKQAQQLTEYKGVDQSYSSGSFSGYSLIEKGNFTSSTLFPQSDGGLNYTDLKQAYIESVIPVTEDDYNKLPKFRDVNEYKNFRESNMVAPMNEKSAMEQLYFQEQQQNEENTALAFYYATQAEKAKKQTNAFWSSLKQLGK